MKTEFTIGDTVKLEILSENKTVLMAMYADDREITFPLSADETEVIIAALQFHKKRVEGK